MRLMNNWFGDSIDEMYVLVAVELVSLYDNPLEKLNPD